jgi:hypothetical protein
MQKLILSFAALATLSLVVPYAAPAKAEDDMHHKMMHHKMMHHKMMHHKMMHHEMMHQN